MGKIGQTERCNRCGKLYIKGSPYSRYCKDGCALEAMAESKKKYMKKYWQFYKNRKCLQA